MKGGRIVAGGVARDGARHEPRRAAQVLPLQTVLRARSAPSRAAALLRGADLSAGEQGGEPGELAGSAGKSRLLSRAGKRRPGAGVAGGASGLRAGAASAAGGVTRAVTRDDERANCSGSEGCEGRRRGGVTRDMAVATTAARWAYRASDGDGVTRGYGAGDAAADNAWASSFGAQAQPIQPPNP